MWSRGGRGYGYVFDEVVEVPKVSARKRADTTSPDWSPAVVLKAAERVQWYRRRVAALERLATCYRMHSQPSEALHRELELTSNYVDHAGDWCGPQ